MVMSTTRSSNDQGSKAPASQQAGCLPLVARLWWMAIGNVILLMFAGLILRSGGGFSIWDVAFWATAASLVVVRYADIRYWKGLTRDGEPADMKHWRNHALITAVASGLLFAAAHLAARHLQI